MATQLSKSQLIERIATSTELSRSHAKRLRSRPRAQPDPLPRWQRQLARAEPPPFRPDRQSG